MAHICIVAVAGYYLQVVDATNIHLYKRNFDEEEWGHVPFAHREKEIPRPPGQNKGDKQKKESKNHQEVPYYKKLMRDT